MDSLQGKVAVVTGASRGVGRGIAEVLGEAGTTVYVTGRSRPNATTENLPGTVDEAAEAVSERGGRGIAVYCDHNHDDQVTALFQRVRDEQGRLDLLVNNVWGGYEQHPGEGFTAPFWEQERRHWHGMFELGVRAQWIASQEAAPIFIAQRSGLIINTVAWSFGDYLGNAVYDVAKAAIVRLAFAMAQDLRAYNVAAIALAPGFTRTERVVEALEDIEEFDWAQTESPEYTGRAARALALDPQIMEKTGQVFATGEIAAEYGFTDIDGRQVPPFRVSPAG